MIRTQAEIGFTSKFIFNADVLVRNADTGFALHLTAVTGDGNLLSGVVTGLSISGKNGAIWDDSGNLIGGFKQGIPFNIEIHQDSGAKSIFKDGTLLKAFAAGQDVLTDVVFEKSTESSLGGNVFPDLGEDICVFGDDSGIFIFYYDNELFGC